MSVNPSVIGKSMSSGNKTNWNAFGKKGKTLMKCNLGSGSSYLTQAKHILHRYSYSTLRIRLNYYGFHNSCNLL